jgi:hypothetical protein
MYKIKNIWFNKTIKLYLFKKKFIVIKGPLGTLNSELVLTKTRIFFPKMNSVMAVEQTK